MKRYKRPNSLIWGFTAIEISMVATIIAIIALLILPLFRRRTDDAKLVAAQDELDSIVKAQVLANADTGHYFRLQDLDNSQSFNDNPVNQDTEVPIAYWNRTISSSERLTLANPEAWQGPYITVKKYVTIGDLRSANHPALWQNGGPIFYIDGSFVDSPLGPDKLTDRYPIDPWGNPYLFFAPGILNNPNNYSGTETDFGHGLVVSLGPNGVPGNDTSVSSGDYRRENGLLATGDDIYIYF